ncbi:heparinase [Pedobacter frigiditerrae]|uniref:Heparinase n=1 Tax=Pedobacter frigiditerrae TaxID=2530452 RepID=A0A4R0MR30_9SPHI|nr:heparinase II/III family protein [Pedobacter frigiditerrae]TCC88732.1 heparinase [Pedobacter frigiditerrae]
MLRKLITFNLLVLFVFNGFSAMAQIKLFNKEYHLPEHPRLLLKKGEENYIKNAIRKDHYWKKVHDDIIDDSEIIIALKPIENIKIGGRLLDKSRECLRRIFYLAYSYRLTGDEKFSKRALQEMLAVSAFKDWNPSHFLDVGEMTTAMAIGYDWLYDNIPKSSRLIIQAAILEKGIKPSLSQGFNWWISTSNNWNQVCNTGMSFGALATYEDHPQLSSTIIERAIDGIQLPMKQYAPDGAYPEGYAYWAYGTTYNVMFISALQTALNSDFDLSKNPGFLNTASYFEHMTGPSGQHFNYSDCSQISEFNPAMVWFSGVSKNRSLLYVEKNKLDGNLNTRSRFLPAAMIWANGISIEDTKPPSLLMWTGNGPNPIALFRTSWTNKDAIYVGFKAGSPSVSHGHMDVGSFILEERGVRWGIDLGMQNYESLEGKGIDLWNMSQNSTRWQVFRYNNLAHNTITINDLAQRVNGSATLESYSNQRSFLNAVSDLTDIYKGQISKLKRGVAIVNKKIIVVRDEVETGNEYVTFRWSMVTQASVEINNHDSAKLTMDGKDLFLRVTGVDDVTFKTWKTEPKNDYDAQNPGTCIVGYEVKLKPNTKYALNVTLASDSSEKSVVANNMSLNNWPKTLK